MPPYILVIFDNDNREIVEIGRHQGQILTMKAVLSLARASLNGLFARPQSLATNSTAPKCELSPETRI